MTDFKVSSADLYNQADLHTRIAQFYDQAAGNISAKSGQVLSELQQWVSGASYQGNKQSDSGDHAETYQQWYNNLVASLQQEADHHRQIAGQLTQLADQVFKAEQLLTVSTPSGGSGKHFVV